MHIFFVYLLDSVWREYIILYLGLYCCPHNSLSSTSLKYYIYNYIYISAPTKSFGGMLDYMADARERLGKPDCQVVPRGGAQFAQLITSESLAMVSSVQKQCSLGFDLSAIGSLQDTGKIFFSKQRLDSVRLLSNMLEYRG